MTLDVSPSTTIPTAVYPSTSSLPSSSKTDIEKNISSDTYYSYEINLEPYASRITRNHRFIAYCISDFIIKLFDMIDRQENWSCALEKSGVGRVVSKLILSPEGMVLAFSEYVGPCVHNKHCHILIGGKQTGFLVIDREKVYERSIRVVNGYIYALTKKMNNCAVLIWNNAGKVEHETSTENFGVGLTSAYHYNTFSTEWKKQICAVNNKFYIVTAVVEDNSSIAIRAYVQDLIKKQTNVLDLQRSKNQITINTATIYGNTIIYAINSVGRPSETSSNISSDPKIVLVNIATGTQEAEYSLYDKQGEVRELVINDDYIVYLIKADDKRDYLWVLDRRNGTQKRILAIPSYRDVKDIDLSFAGQLLNICYSDGCWERNNDVASHVFCVLDLSTKKIVKKNSYVRSGQYKMSFENGRLVLCNQIDSRNMVGWDSSICIKDFSNVFPRA